MCIFWNSFAHQKEGSWAICLCWSHKRAVTHSAAPQSAVRRRNDWIDVTIIRSPLYATRTCSSVKAYFPVQHHRGKSVESGRYQLIWTSNHRNNGTTRFQHAQEQKSFWLTLPVGIAQMSRHPAPGRTATTRRINLLNLSHVYS